MIMEVSAGVTLRLKKELRFEDRGCLLTGSLLSLDWAGRISVQFIKACDCVKLTYTCLGSYAFV